MAVSTRTMTRHRDYSRLLIALGVIAGIVAIAPIIAAAMGLGSKVAAPRTAFASAPAGEYAVITRSEGAADVIAVARADNPGALTEIARIARMDGFPSAGSVSPDGRLVALTVVDGGSFALPVASVRILNLETAEDLRVAAGAQPGQAPVWSPDGSAVAFARSIASAGTVGQITIGRVSVNGKDESTPQEFRGVLGAYPVGYDADGRLSTVVLDGEGSALHRMGLEPLRLSANLTRDWELSPDGSGLAFIEVVTEGGVGYAARTVSLSGDADLAQALSAPVSALGAAWNPASREASFGLEPGLAGEQSAQALVVSAGFDVPLGYSASGESLAVTHWSGSSFEESGTPTLQLVTAGGRANYDGFTRFLGWSVR